MFVKKWDVFANNSIVICLEMPSFSDPNSLSVLQVHNSVSSKLNFLFDLKQGYMVKKNKRGGKKEERKSLV